MYFIGVILDSKNFENIKAEVKKYKEKIRLIKINTKTIENLQNIKFDLIILNNELDKFNKQEQILKKICQNAKYIALNVDIQMKKNILENVKTNIITFGLNSKATVTLSSITQEECLIDLQRNIENIEKNIIEMGEEHIILTETSNLRNYEILIIYIIFVIFNLK